MGESALRPRQRCRVCRRGWRSSRRLSGTPPSTTRAAPGPPSPPAPAPPRCARRAANARTGRPVAPSPCRPLGLRKRAEVVARLGGRKERLPWHHGPPSSAPAGLAVGFGPKESSPTLAFAGDSPRGPSKSEVGPPPPRATRELGVLAFCYQMVVYAWQQSLSTPKMGSLFTGVRGIGILRSSHKPNSTKFGAFLVL
jgi:hypothetical protein